MWSLTCLSMLYTVPSRNPEMEESFLMSLLNCLTFFFEYVPTNRGVSVSLAQVES